MLNVWKNVKRYAQDGFTSVIHGKHWHEETRATASQAAAVRPAATTSSCSIAPRRRWSATTSPAARTPLSRAALLERFREAVSPGFDPDLHLGRIGCANQTTMLSSESFAIGEMFRAAIARALRRRPAAGERFRAFDTICSATQDRQDAVERMLADDALDLMLVVGGYNSSNTCNLARICAASVPTFHIADPDGLIAADEIRHRDVATKAEVVTRDWLPRGRPIAVGLTSGASTPDNLVEAVVRTLERFAAAP